MKLCYVAVLLFGAAAYIPVSRYEDREEAIAKRNQARLEEMCWAVPIFPGATLLQYDASHKFGQCHVGGTYRTRALFAEIRAYYDAALLKQGWHFEREYPMRTWGMDLGGRTARYKNGIFSADLEYADERATHGWNYALTFTWGLY